MGMIFISDILSYTVFAVLLQTGNPFRWPLIYQPAQGNLYLHQNDRTAESLTDANVARKSAFLHPHIPLITIDGDPKGSDIVTMGRAPSSGITLNCMSYESDRIAYNMVVQTLLSRGQQALVMEQLQKLRDMNIELSIDTVNILISDSFSRKDTENVECLYRLHFQSKALKPSTRTLNILMEGYRALRDEAKVFYYRDCFRHYGLPMDSYTYSTLVRTVRSAAAVKSVMLTAEAGESLSFPLIRCAIESLGKLGDPLAAVALAGRLLTGRSIVRKGSDDTSMERDRDCNNVASIFDSSSSGDSLLIALLENPDLYLLSIASHSEINVVDSSLISHEINGSSDASDLSHGGDSSRSSSDIERKISSGGMYGRGADFTEKITALERRVQGMTCGDAALELVLSAILLDTDSSSGNTRSLSAAISTGVNSPTAISGLDSIPNIVSPKSFEDGNESAGVLACSSKGWCRLFTFLQRSVRETLEEENRSKDFRNSNEMKALNEASKLRLKKLRDSRDRLWSKLSAEILMSESRKEGQALVQEGLLRSKRKLEMGMVVEEGEDTTGVTSSDAASIVAGHDGEAYILEVDVDNAPSPVTDISSQSMNMRGKIELNGRISDSVLRCYLEDAEKAKKMWKNTILPLSKRLSASSSSSRSFDEICEKSLEALMFVSGYNGRADLGFEIALTVRNRNWGDRIRTKLAKSYVQGKMQSRGYKSQWLKSNILNDGLERSIESELGVQLLDFYSDSSSLRSKSKQTKWPVKTIRIQF